MQKPIHVIDFEGHTSYGIIEYGIVTISPENGTIEKCITGICKPSARISRRDICLHGLNQKLTQKKLSFSEQYDLFKELRESGTFAAHQAQVERSLLQGYWSYPPFCHNPLNSDGEIADWGPWIDTCRLCRRFYSNLESYKLQDLIAGFGLKAPLAQLAMQYCPEKRQKYHCALFDALASTLLLLKLIPELNTTKDRLIPAIIRESQSLEQRRQFDQQELF